MLKIIGRISLQTIVVFVAAYILPGIKVDSFLTALVVAVVLSLLNSFVKPFIILLTIPITILTLGLFLLVINALMAGLASYLVDGFYIDSFWHALLFSFVVSLFYSFFVGLAEKDEIEKRKQNKENL
ncbi:MAG: phage holin family protein [Luteibaculaceae bacterium]